METPESTPPSTESADRTARGSSPTRGGWPRLGVFIVVAALVGVGIGYSLASRDDGASSEQGGGSEERGAVALSPKALETLAKALGQPIYWLGTEPSMTYEVLQLPTGRVNIRYLPEGTEVGDSGTFLTVGTYGVRNAFEVVESGTREAGASAIEVAGGGVGLVRTSDPFSVYVAYPGSDYEIEVYSPEPQEARRFVESGRLEAVGGAP